MTKYTGDLVTDYPYDQSTLVFTIGSESHNVIASSADVTLVTDVKGHYYEWQL